MATLLDLPRKISFLDRILDKPTCISLEYIILGTLPGKPKFNLGSRELLNNFLPPSADYARISRKGPHHAPLPLVSTRPTRILSRISNFSRFTFYHVAPLPTVHFDDGVARFYHKLLLSSFSIRPSSHQTPRPQAIMSVRSTFPPLNPRGSFSKIEVVVEVLTVSDAYVLYNLLATVRRQLSAVSMARGLLNKTDTRARGSTAITGSRTFRERLHGQDGRRRDGVITFIWDLVPAANNDHFNRAHLLAGCNKDL